MLIPLCLGSFFLAGGTGAAMLCPFSGTALLSARKCSWLDSGTWLMASLLCRPVDLATKSEPFTGKDVISDTQRTCLTPVHCRSLGTVL